MTDKALVNQHAQAFIREVLADQLIQAGFVSRKEQDIQWYRVVNDNVLQAVLFNTQWAALPMLLAVSYSCHPLFIPPEFPKSVHVPNMMRSIEAVNPGRYLFKQNNNMVYSPKAAVTCPNDAYKGADILADILSKLDEVKSIEQCYNMHKAGRLKAAEICKLPPEELFWNISPDFMDEVVYLDDIEMYPYCRKRIISELERYEKAQQVRKLWNVEKAELESLKFLKAAVLEGKRDGHLRVLEERRAESIRQLKRQTRISII